MTTDLLRHIIFDPCDFLQSESEILAKKLKCKKLINLQFDIFKDYSQVTEDDEKADDVVFFCFYGKRANNRNLNDFRKNYFKKFPLVWKYFCLVQNCAEEECVCNYIKKGKYHFIVTMTENSMQLFFFF